MVKTKQKNTIFCLLKPVQKQELISNHCFEKLQLRCQEWTALPQAQDKPLHLIVISINFCSSSVRNVILEPQANTNPTTEQKGTTIYGYNCQC
jgi:hypothetical protein